MNWVMLAEYGRFLEIHFSNSFDLLLKLFTVITAG